MATRTGVVQWELQDAKSQFYPLGLYRQGTGEDQRVAVDALAGEVVFRQPDGVEPQFFDKLGLGQALLYLLLVVGVVKFHRIEKVTEAHSYSSI